MPLPLLRHGTQLFSRQCCHHPFPPPPSLHYTIQTIASDVSARNIPGVDRGVISLGCRWLAADRFVRGWGVFLIAQGGIKNPKFAVTGQLWQHGFGMKTCQVFDKPSEGKFKTKAGGNSPELRSSVMVGLHNVLTTLLFSKFFIA